jgi:amino acid adenylation domain-containing protein
MAFATHPTCYIIGSSSLLVKCAKVIQLSGWKIMGICSIDDAVKQWAHNHHIPLYPDYFSLKEAILSQPPDFLFSIVNETIIEASVLKVVKQLSINYHDALLPDYAGMYATFWALYNQEKNHGITWHIMHPEIDSGPILLQKTVAIEPNDTTLSLNLKCFELAIEGFQVLIHQLENNAFQPTSQNTTKRRYNSLYKRPPHFSVISFNQSAHSILTQWQSFNWGNNINNVIGTPKIRLNGSFYIIEKMVILPESSQGKAGTLYQIKENGILVNTTDFIIQIERLKTIYGAYQSLNDFQLLPLVLNHFEDSETNYYNEQLYLKAVKKESEWANRLLNLNCLPMPFIYHPGTSNHAKSAIPFQLPVMNEWDFNEIKTQTELQYLSLLVLFLARISDEQEFDLPIYNADENKINLFHPIKPISFQVLPHEEGSIALKKIYTSLEKEADQPPFLYDIIERYPLLKNNIEPEILQQFKLTAEIVEVFKMPSELKSDWHIQLNKRDYTWQIYFNDFGSNKLIAAQFISCFQTFVAEVKKDAKLLDINVIPEKEWQEIVVESNSRKISFPNTLGIHHLFHYQVNTQPEGIALIDQDKVLTYQALDQLSNQIAHALVTNGCQPNEKIGILLDRNTNHIAAMLGILKFGCAYVPLPPDYPLARIQFMMADSDIKCLITATKSFVNIELNPKTIINTEELASYSAEKFENPHFSPDDTAYVIYTSGSTGNPKGVPISHLNVVNFLYSIRAVLNQKHKRIGAVTAPFNFDVSVEEIFSTICFGGTAHLIPQSLMLQPAEMVQYIHQNKVNTIFITPALLPKIAEAFTPETIQPLKFLLSGVQPKLNEAFHKFRNLSPDLKIINTYGPTEVTFGPTAYTYLGQEKDAEETPIGQGLPNYTLYVVNKNRKVVPNYIPGELLVGGPSVTKGYLNLPDLNLEKFIQLPFAEPNDIQYCTGDMVYRDANNDLHFIGRKDNQVKIRGFRIELGEIETTLKGNESVENAVVVAKKVHQSHQQLVAYVQPNKNQSISAEGLKKYLENVLPKHAVPSYFVLLEDIPLHPNGKINYQKLPKIQPIVENRVLVLPDNPIEIDLHIIWQSVLQQTQISVEDNFFVIGGDSLTAIEVIEQFQKHHEKKISLAMFYNFQTIRSFAAAFNRDAGWYAANPLTQLRKGGNEAPIFFIHGLNGSIAVMKPIIDELKLKNALYAFQAASNYETYSSFEALAADYVNAIKSMHIHRCVLCGFSFGGILAFEMAHQLQSAGIEVKLIQLDSKPYVVLKHQKKLYYRFLYGAKVLQWMILGNSTANHAPAQNGKNVAEATFYSRIKKLQNRIKSSQSKKMIPPKLPLNIYQKMALKSRNLVNRYQPPKYFIDMTLIKSSKEKEGFIGFGFNKNGWSKYTTGKITIETLPIYHYDFDKIENAAPLATIIEMHCRRDTNQSS